MSAGHTPGPWHYRPSNGSPTHGMHMIAGSKPGYLAEVRDCGSGDVKANARLIAAAPELLEALEEMVRWYAKRETASMYVSGGEGLQPIEAQDEEVQQAIRAIAKATGATP